MKDLRLWIFIGLLVILAVQVISCAPPPGPAGGKSTGLTTERTKGNWTYVPINRDRFDPEADLAVLSAWEDTNFMREVMAFQIIYGQNAYGTIVNTYGVWINSRKIKP